MSFQEILEELARLTPADREEIIRRLVELDEAGADRAALSRAQELASGSVLAKTQAKVFHNARATLG